MTNEDHECCSEKECKLDMRICEKNIKVSVKALVDSINLTKKPCELDMPLFILWAGYKGYAIQQIRGVELDDKSISSTLKTVANAIKNDFMEGLK